MSHRSNRMRKGYLTVVLSLSLLAVSTQGAFAQIDPNDVPGRCYGPNCDAYNNNITVPQSWDNNEDTEYRYRPERKKEPARRKPAPKPREFKALKKESLAAERELRKGFRLPPAQAVQSPAVRVAPPEQGKKVMGLKETSPSPWDMERYGLHLRQPTQVFSGTRLDRERLEKAAAVLRHAAGANVSGEEAYFLSSQAGAIMLGQPSRVRVDDGAGPALSEEQAHQVAEELRFIEQMEERIYQAAEKRRGIRTKLKKTVQKRRDLTFRIEKGKAGNSLPTEDLARLEDERNALQADIDKKAYEYAALFEQETAAATKIAESKKKVRVILLGN